MNQQSIFSSTLGLTKPWKITSVEIADNCPRLDIFITCSQSLSIPCPVCGGEARICDSAEESWRHASFFNKEAVVHAMVPVITCASKCRCYKVHAPWAHAGSRFVLQEERLPPKCIDCCKAETITHISI